MTIQAAQQRFFRTDYRFLPQYGAVQSHSQQYLRDGNSSPLALGTPFKALLTMPTSAIKTLYEKESPGS
ncbi:MAG: hypothetical protein SFU25_06085, partial [Candidatus Caenarcaniphilales bacterium]|nr:hypothetical protein [Candidatus Caenarcaniphilales bacterium]